MEDEGNYFVNEADGLPNQHPVPYETIVEQSENIEQDNIDDDTLDDLPMSIIVTNIHSEVFNSDELKKEMESLFRKFSDQVTFQWLKSFRRLRVNFDNPLSAGNLFIHSNNN
jgi:hypothetical protein